VQHLALLRGINVGGGNLIRMADLKACFEGVGCANVSTYIASGNVVFRSAEKDAARLLGKIERALSARFAYEARAVVFTHKARRRHGRSREGRTVLFTADQQAGAKPSAQDHRSARVSADDHPELEHHDQIARLDERLRRVAAEQRRGLHIPTACAHMPRSTILRQSPE
jgi:hypothetical protein